MLSNINYSIKNFKLTIDELKLSNGLNLIYGESGSGKSTLVDILLGFRTCKGFGMQFEGVDYASLSLSDKKIGLVLQKGEVFPHLTGLQCLKFAARARAVKDEQFCADLDLFLDRLNLSSEKLNQQTLTLSGGEKQRLAIMCALIGQPKVLIFDEPFSALDTVNKNNAFDLVKDFSVGRKVPLIMVSHDDNFKALIDTSFKLFDGKIAT